MEPFPCTRCNTPLPIARGLWPPVCPACTHDHWCLAGETLTRDDVRTARAVVRCVAAEDTERGRALYTELLQRVLEAIAAHRTEDNPCDVADLATADDPTATGHTEAPVDPWGVLRAVRAFPLVAATADDDPINGGDAVDELGAIRELLDAVLAHPTAR